MSFGRIAAAMHIKGLSLAEMRILTLLADHENDKTGRCNPSYTTLAEESELSARYVKIIVGKLKDRGYVRVSQEKTNNRFDLNTYSFSFPKISLPKSSGEPQFTTHSEPQFTTVVNSKSPGVVNYSSPGVVNHSSPKPRSKNQEIESRKEPLPPQPPPSGGGEDLSDRSYPPDLDTVKSRLKSETGYCVPDIPEVSAAIQDIIRLGWRDAKHKPVSDWRRYVIGISRKVANDLWKSSAEERKRKHEEEMHDLFVRNMLAEGPED